MELWTVFTLFSYNAAETRLAELTQFDKEKDQKLFIRIKYIKIGSGSLSLG